MTDTRDELERVLRPLVGAHADIVTNAIEVSGVLDNLRADAWDECAATIARDTGVRILPERNPYRKSATS